MAERKNAAKPPDKIDRYGQQRVTQELATNGDVEGRNMQRMVRRKGEVGDRYGNRDRRHDDQEDHRTAVQAA